MLWPTVSQPVCLRVKHLSGTYDQIFITVRLLQVYWCEGALSDERMGLPFTIAACPCQRNHSWVWVPRDSWPYFTVSDSRLPQTEGPGTGFPSCHPLQLAGVRWRLSHWMLFYSLGTDCMQNTASHGSLVANVFISMDICLPCRCLAMTISTGLCYSTFRAS
jgi:hypothetical protein